MVKRMMIVCAITLAVVSCSTKKYDENFTKAYVSAQICYGSSELIIDNTARVWRNAIYDNVDSHGNYCYDFNTALSRLFSDYEEKDVFSSINEYQGELKNAVASLSKVPKSRKEAYDEMLQIATEINMLCDMAKDPSGSLQSYRDQSKDLLFSIKKRLDSFELKHSEFLIESIMKGIEND